MRRLTHWLALVALAVAGSLIFGDSAMAEPDTKATPVKIQEREIKFEELPAPVQVTVLKEAGDHLLTEIEEISAGKKVIYEAEWIEDDMEVEIRVAPDGTLLGRSTEKPDDEVEDDDDEDDGEDD